MEKPANGFQKPVKVSAELASWLGGVTEISRPQLTAAFWKYVKDNGLQVGVCPCCFVCQSENKQC